MFGKSSKGSTTLVAAWAVAVAAGFAAIVRYDATPGVETKSSPPRWPADAGIARTPDRPTLLVFLHPRCPCSDATLGELEEILAKAGRPLDARVLFVAPAGTPPDWTRGALRNRAERIPRVVVADDAGGALADLFGVETSGTTLLFDGDGRLAFRGGVTPSRGHLGDGVGRSSLAALLAGGAADAATAPVFGCPLQSPADAQAPR